MEKLGHWAKNENVWPYPFFPLSNPSKCLAVRQNQNPQASRHFLTLRHKGTSPAHGSHWHIGGRGTRSLVMEGPSLVSYLNPKCTSTTRRQRASLPMSQTAQMKTPPWTGSNPTSHSWTSFDTLPPNPPHPKKFPQWEGSMIFPTSPEATKTLMITIVSRMYCAHGDNTLTSLGYRLFLLTLSPFHSFFILNMISVTTGPGIVSWTIITAIQTSALRCNEREALLLHAVTATPPTPLGLP